MNPSSPMRVGILGCGNISQAYFNGCKLFRALEVVACTDINMEVARAKASENKVEARSVDELLAADDIDIIVNLTIPAVHAEVSLRVLESGKHVYSEKPFAIELEDSAKILRLAGRKGLRAGSAPDTFLGAGLQTCRKLIDDNWIGRPVAGTAFLMSAGPESWHPNPAFFYQYGGGPMLDMGPYYITALVHLLGPVVSVTAVTAKARDVRMATGDKTFGLRLPVEVPTHNSGTVVFANGAVVTMVVSFDVRRHTHPPIEIYGLGGSLCVPDPNTFGGPVSVFRPGNDGWQAAAFTHAYTTNSRGIGVADMAHAILGNRPHRCSGELAHHVLEVMHAFHLSSQQGTRIDLKSSCPRPSAFPLDLPPGVLDQ